MKNNYYILLSLTSLLLLITITITKAQNPYRLLKKAEQLHQQGHLRKALLKIEQAKAAANGYCTCGDCVETFQNGINQLKSEVYLAKGEPQVALEVLNTIEITPYSSKKVDSLRILCYQAALGKAFLAQHIDKGLENLILSCEGMGETCFVTIPLEKSSTSMHFVLPLGGTVLQCLYYNCDKEKVKKEWVAQFKQSSLYSLIQQKE